MPEVALAAAAAWQAGRVESLAASSVFIGCHCEDCDEDDKKSCLCGIQLCGMQFGFHVRNLHMAYSTLKQGPRLRSRCWRWRWAVVHALRAFSWQTVAEASRQPIVEPIARRVGRDDRLAHYAARALFRSASERRAEAFARF